MTEYRRDSSVSIRPREATIIVRRRYQRRSMQIGENGILISHHSCIVIVLLIKVDFSRTSARFRLSPCGFAEDDLSCFSTGA